MIGGHRCQAVYKICSWWKYISIPFISIHIWLCHMLLARTKIFPLIWVLDDGHFNYNLAMPSPQRERGRKPQKKSWLIHGLWINHRSSSLNKARHESLPLNVPAFLLTNRLRFSRMFFFLNRCIGEGHVQTGHSTPTAPATRKKQVLVQRVVEVVYFNRIWEWTGGVDMVFFFASWCYPLGCNFPPPILIWLVVSNIF